MSLAQTSEEEHRSTSVDLRKEHQELLARISMKENKLRNLRLLQSYRGDSSTSEANIQKWRKALRDAIIAIDHEHPQPKPPVAYFITTLGIDPESIGFNTQNECFDDL